MNRLIHHPNAGGNEDHSQIRSADTVQVPEEIPVSKASGKGGDDPVKDGSWWNVRHAADEDAGGKGVEAGNRGSDAAIDYSKEVGRWGIDRCFDGKGGWGGSGEEEGALEESEIGEAEGLVFVGGPAPGEQGLGRAVAKLLERGRRSGSGGSGGEGVLELFGDLEDKGVGEGSTDGGEAAGCRGDRKGEGRYSQTAERAERERGRSGGGEGGGRGAAGHGWVGQSNKNAANGN